MGILGKIPKHLFDGHLGIDRLEEQMQEVHHMWDNYFEKLDEIEIARIVHYRSTGERKYSNQVEDILAQLFGHSWYHRGQIALIVRELGGTPAKTDHVFWTRKKLK